MQTIEEIKQNMTDYMDDDSEAALQTVPEQYWLLLSEASENVAGELGMDTEIAVTHDTLEDFDDGSRRWAECKTREQQVIGGFPARLYKGVQPKRGERRVDVVLAIRLDPITVVLTA